MAWTPLRIAFVTSITIMLGFLLFKNSQSPDIPLQSGSKAVNSLPEDSALPTQVTKQNFPIQQLPPLKNVLTPQVIDLKPPTSTRSSEPTRQLVSFKRSVASFALAEFKKVTGISFQPATPIEDFDTYEINSQIFVFESKGSQTSGAIFLSHGRNLNASALLAKIGEKYDVDFSKATLVDSGISTVTAGERYILFFAGGNSDSYLVANLRSTPFSRADISAFKLSLRR